MWRTDGHTDGQSQLWAHCWWELQRAKRAYLTNRTLSVANKAQKGLEADTKWCGNIAINPVSLFLIQPLLRVNSIDCLRTELSVPYKIDISSHAIPIIPRIMERNAKLRCLGQSSSAVLVPGLITNDATNHWTDVLHLTSKWISAGDFMRQIFSFDWVLPTVKWDNMWKWKFYSPAVIILPVSLDNELISWWRFTRCNENKTGWDSVTPMHPSGVGALINQ